MTECLLGCLLVLSFSASFLSALLNYDTNGTEVVCSSRERLNWAKMFFCWEDGEGC